MRKPGSICNDVVDVPRSLYDKTRDPEVKKHLADETSQAAERGVFGVPTMIVDRELFWGNDRLEFVERYLDGHDEVDEEAYEKARDIDQIER